MMVKTMEEKKAIANSDKRKYFYAVGRRKTSTAQVRIYEKGTGEVIVNGKEMKKYFPTVQLQNKIIDPMEKVGLTDKYDISVLVKGGGVNGQAESIRHGISRALLKIDEDLRSSLKSEGYLTRDPRMKERKKPGLRRARRAPQWSKR